MPRAKKNEVAENQVETAAPDTAQEEVPKRLDIINGRMPLPLVHLIRFDEGGAKDSEVAAKFFTSTGKVSDIRKNRNFQYVTENMPFTKADIDAAKEFITRPSLQGNHISEENQAQIVRALDTLTVDENAAAAITEARKSVRQTTKKDKPAETETAPETGSLEDAI